MQVQFFSLGGEEKKKNNLETAENLFLFGERKKKRGRGGKRGKRVPGLSWTIAWRGKSAFFSPPLPEGAKGRGGKVPKGQSICRYLKKKKEKKNWFIQSLGRKKEEREKGEGGKGVLSALAIVSLPPCNPTFVCKKKGWEGKKRAWRSVAPRDWESGKMNFLLRTGGGKKEGKGKFPDSATCFDWQEEKGKKKGGG